VTELDDKAAYCHSPVRSGIVHFGDADGGRFISAGLSDELAPCKRPPAKNLID